MVLLIIGVGVGLVIDVVVVGVVVVVMFLFGLVRMLFIEWVLIIECIVVLVVCLRVLFGLLVENRYLCGFDIWYCMLKFIVMMFLLLVSMCTWLIMVCMWVVFILDMVFMGVGSLKWKFGLSVCE